MTYNVFGGMLNLAQLNSTPTEEFLSIGNLGFTGIRTLDW